jgi:vacuolar-type H+-ATPase subunit I/STV1
MTMNGKLGNEQRKAIEKLVQNSFSRKITQQREAYNDAVSRVTKEVKDELGITAMDDQLKALKQKIADLETEKESLGISKYNDTFILGSKTKEIIDQKTANDRRAIKELEAQMDKIISTIWTAEDISEIKPMVDGLVE